RSRRAITGSFSLASPPERCSMARPSRCSTFATTVFTIERSCEPRSIRREQLDLEVERGVGRNALAAAQRPVPGGRGDRQLADLADLHSGHGFVPALDHIARSDLDRERFPRVARAV